MLPDTFQMADKNPKVATQLTKYQQHGMQWGSHPPKLEPPSPKNS